MSARVASDPSGGKTRSMHTFADRMLFAGTLVPGTVSRFFRSLRGLNFGHDRRSVQKSTAGAQTSLAAPGRRTAGAGALPNLSVASC